MINPLTEVKIVCAQTTDLVVPLRHCDAVCSMRRWCPEYASADHRRTWGVSPTADETRRYLGLELKKIFKL